MRRVVRQSEKRLSGGEAGRERNGEESERRSEGKKERDGEKEAQRKQKGKIDPRRRKNQEGVWCVTH